MIREACIDDIPQMILMADMKRSEYERYAPTFWRKAKDGVQKQAPYFCDQLSANDTICLASELDKSLDPFSGVVFRKSGRLCRPHEGLSAMAGQNGVRPA